MVAGAAVFICRDCVDTCVQVFAADAEWRETKIAELRERRDPSDPQPSN
jgi:hypothetical protein